MNTLTTEPWSVKDAKSKLSELLRHAREQGPQVIGTRDQCVVVPLELWHSYVQPEESLGAWLATNSPRADLDLPERGKCSGERDVPFSDF